MEIPGFICTALLCFSILRSRTGHRKCSCSDGVLAGGSLREASLLLCTCFITGLMQRFLFLLSRGRLLPPNCSFPSIIPGSHFPVMSPEKGRQPTDPGRITALFYLCPMNTLSPQPAQCQRTGSHNQRSNSSVYTHSLTHSLTHNTYSKVKDKDAS